MITNSIEQRGQIDFDMCWFLTSLFECYLEQDITNTKIYKEI